MAMTNETVDSIEMGVQITDIVNDESGIDTDATLSRYIEWLTEKLAQDYPNADIDIHAGIDDLRVNGRRDTDGSDPLYQEVSNLIQYYWEGTMDEWIVEA